MDLFVVYLVLNWLFFYSRVLIIGFVVFVIMFYCFNKVC